MLSVTAVAGGNEHGIFLEIGILNGNWIGIGFAVMLVKMSSYCP